jgi:ATP-dependent Clp protease adaptor protein ClpS
MIHLQTKKTHNAQKHELFPSLEGYNTPNMTMGTHPQEDSGDLLLLVSKTHVQRPNMFRVLMLNDDFTPMEFVVEVLSEVFHMPHEQATQVMLQVHHEGKGVCGVFTRDIAETKAQIVEAIAYQHEYPLRCEVTPDV